MEPEPQLDEIVYTQRHSLVVPAKLQDLVPVIEAHLKTQFAEVKVSVEKCPDLTKWGLVKPGICSSSAASQKIVEVGDVVNVAKAKARNITHSLKQVGKALDMPDGYVIGASVIPLKVNGQSGELIPSQDLATHTRNSYFAQVAEDKSMKCSKYDSDQFGMFATLYLSEGQQGDVLRIEASKRTGDESYPCAIASALSKYPGVGGSKQIGLGGAFSVESGKVRAHAVPKYGDDEDLTIPQLFETMHRYEAGPELTCCSVILSADPTGGAMLNRTEHAHFFRRDGTQGGDFEEGVTKEEMHYIGYYTPAGSVYKLNNPTDKSDQ